MTKNPTMQRTFAPLLALVTAACASTAPAPEPTPVPVEAAPVRQTPPPPAPAEPVDFPTFHERTLSNGARVIVVESGEQPYVSVNLRVRTGTAADPEGKAGLAGMTAALLDKGTPTRSAQEIAEAVDFVGATLGASASADWTSITAGTLTEHLDPVLDLMADVVTNPTFPEGELQTERQRTLSGLQVELSQPAQIATRRFMAEVFGDHPYGDAPTPETVRALTRADLEAFHRAYYHPTNALFVVAGDVRVDDVVGKLEREFGAWQAGTAPAVAMAPPPAPLRRLVFVHKPGTVQAVIRIGHLLPAASDDDWVALDVTNNVLGGGVQGRLFRILRDEKGYTYGSYSSSAERQAAGYFSASAEVRNEVADSALAEMITQIERLQDEPVPAQELADAKNYLSGSFPLSIETPMQVAGQVATTLLLGRPADYLETYRQKVEATGPGDVQFTAQQHLRPNEAVIVVVGDADQILSKVRPFADSVAIYDPTGRVIPVASIGAAAPTLSFDVSGTEPRTTVYSLVFQGNPIGEATTEVARETRDGRPVIRSTTTLSGAVAQSQEVIFDAHSFRPIESTVSGGPAGMELRVENGKVIGEVRAPGQAARAVDVAYTDGLLLPGMDDFAIAVTDLQRHRQFSIPVVTQDGAVASVGVRVVGETTIEVPAGSFPVYELDISGPQAMTVFVRKQAPHIVVKQVLPAPPIALELKEVRQ